MTAVSPEPVERRRRPLVGPLMAAAPVSLPVTLTALGTWGVVLMPKSPFWVLGPLAVLAALRRRGVSRMT